MIIEIGHSDTTRRKVLIFGRGAQFEWNYARTISNTPNIFTRKPLMYQYIHIWHLHQINFAC